MKFKNVLITFGLAAVLGLGVGAGLGANKEVKQAKAYVSTASFGDHMYLRGGMNGWGATEFTLNNETSRYEVEVAASSLYEFKITNDTKWSNETAVDPYYEIGSGWWEGNGFSDVNFLNFLEGSGTNFKLKETGNYVFYWNKGATANNVCADIGIEKKADPVVYNPHDYSLAYAPSWDATSTTYNFVKSQDETTAALNINHQSDDPLIFKIVEDHSWNESYGWSNVTVDSALSHVVKESEGNISIIERGAYTITISINTETYSVTSIQISGTPAAVYTVQFGENTYELARQENGSYAAEYAGTVNVVAGQTPVFKRLGSTISAAPDVTNNQNINVLNGQVLETSNGAALWFHITDNAGTLSYSFWLGGRTISFYISVAGVLHPMEVNPNNNNEYMALSISVAANDVIRFYAAELFDATLSGSAAGTWTSPEGQLIAGEAGTFNFYLTPSQDNNTLYIDDLSAADKEALAWAEDFVTNVGCNGTTKPSNWDRYASDEGTYSWSFNLSDDAKHIFIVAAASNAENASFVQKAVFIHDMCVAKYQACSTFMSYSGGSRSAAIYVQPSNSTNSFDATIAIVAIVATSALFVGGIFLLKKKRED